MSIRHLTFLPMSSKGELVLPLGNIPFWDQKRSAEEETELKSVSERYAAHCDVFKIY